MFDDDDDFYGNEDSFDNFDGGFDYDDPDDCYYSDQQELLDDFDGMDGFDRYELNNEQDDFFDEIEDDVQRSQNLYSPHVENEHSHSMFDSHDSIFHSLMPFFLLSWLSRNQETPAGYAQTEETSHRGYLVSMIVLIIIGAVVAIICM